MHFASSSNARSVIKSKNLTFEVSKSSWNLSAFSELLLMQIKLVFLFDQLTCKRISYAISRSSNDNVFIFHAGLFFDLTGFLTHKHHGQNN